MDEVNKIMDEFERFAHRRELVDSLKNIKPIVFNVYMED